MITLHKATAEDLPELQRLNEEAFESEFTHDTDLDMSWALSEEGKQHFADILESPQSACFVAEEDGKMVGYITLSPRSMPYRKTKSAEIDDIGVSPKYRSHGIGSMLIEKGKEWAKESGYEKVYVVAYTKNTQAITFYQNHGFTDLDVGLEVTL